MRSGAISSPLEPAAASAVVVALFPEDMGLATEPPEKSSFGLGASTLDRGTVNNCFPPSLSLNRSSKSNSSLPFDGKTWYSDLDGSRSAYQAVIFASTRTMVVLDVSARTSIENW